MRENATTQDALQTAEAALRSAKAQIDVLKAQIEQTQLDAARRRGEPQLHQDLRADVRARWSRRAPSRARR